MTIRVGALCPRAPLAAWQKAALQAVRETSGVELTMLGLDDAASARLKDQPEWRAGRPHMFAAGALDRSVAALRPVEFDDIVSLVPRVLIWSGTDEQAAERAAALADIDVVVDLRYPSARSDAEPIPRLGRFHYESGSNEMPAAGSLPGPAELIGSTPTLTRSLVHTTTDGSRTTWIVGNFRRSSRSWRATLNDMLIGSTPWLATACRCLVAGVEPGPQAPAAEPDVADSSVSSTALASAAAAMAGRHLLAKLHKATHVDEWEIGIADVGLEAWIDASRPKVRWLGLSSRSGYVADPFGIGSPVDGTLLAEFYDYRSRHGSLVTTRFSEGRPTGGLATLANQHHHLSYPFPVASDDTTYVVPECSASATTTLYRLAGNTLEPIAEILPGEALVDPTLLHWEGRWWLLATHAGVEPDAALHVYWADELIGPWSPHPANPVKTDVRSSRPAGTPFVVDGLLYRPAQDCSQSYGGALSINHVSTLSPTAFHEQPIRRIEPFADRPDGIHHLSAFGTGATLIDGRRDRRSWVYAPHVLRSTAAPIVRRARARCRRPPRSLNRPVEPNWSLPRPGPLP